MNAIQIAFLVAFTAFTIIFMAIILLQKKRSSGLGAQMTGGSANSSGTYWDKNKNNSAEGKLEKYTAICGVIFFVTALIISLVW